MSGTLISSLIQHLGGVYNDPQFIIRDTKSLLPSPLGHHNDGTTTPPVPLLTGTLPMTYSGAKYNLPIDLYLPLPYPLRPPMSNCSPFFPCCFFNSTAFNQLLSTFNNLSNSTLQSIKLFFLSSPSFINSPLRLSYSLASFDPEIPPSSLPSSLGFLM